MDREKNLQSDSRGQTLPMVLVMSTVLAVLAFSMFFLFRQQNLTIVRFADVLRNQELANIALEHALFKLQSGSNWYQLPLAGFQYDKPYNSANGSYAINIIEGNLFMNSGVRQAQDDFRTIGIKVKSANTGTMHQYYAVVKKGSYAGVLISRGMIDLPFPANAADNFHFMWGDIYSANPADNMCRIPFIKVGNGNVKPQYWLPEVYAKGNIYTSYDATTNWLGTITSYKFNYTYTDMSPTARCHPYSTNAQAPSVDLDFYRYQAWKRNSYYGPATVGGSANPYYCGKALTQVTQANLVRVFVNNLNTDDDVLFIDSTDGLPVSGTNTYTGVTYVTASTIHIWTDANNQYCTRGSMLVMGPLILEGDNPDKPNNTGYSDVTGVVAPANYYYPQTSADYYNYSNGNLSNCYISNVKHKGFLYMGGQLQIGGLTSGTDSIIVIYGSIYLDQYGSLVATTGTDAAQLWVYFNTNANMFGYMGTGVAVVSFNELTWLVPTPGAAFPSP